MHEPVMLVVLSASRGPAQNERHYEHLGTAYIAAYLRKFGYGVKILDQNILHLSREALVQQVAEHAPQVLGLACYQDAYLELLAFVREVKERLPETHICLGGVFATNSYLRIFAELPELDSVVLGDGEETFLKLTEAVLGDRDWHELPHMTFPGDPLHHVKTPKYDTDLDSLPDPARDTLPLVLGQELFPIVSASRGCYGHCSYCSITIQNRRRRTRDMERVLDELEQLRKDFHVRYFYFIDDTFIGRTPEDYQRIEQFAQGLIRRKMDIQFSIECRANEVDPALMKMLKEVGLFTVFLGLESGYQPTLNLFKKGVQVEQNLRAIQILTDLQIRYILGFIMFHPYSTLEEVAANLEFLQHVEQKNFLDSLHRRLMVFNNAPIADTLRADGITCNPWYSTNVPFLNPEVEPLYKFVEQFTAELKPEINRLAVYYSQTENAEHQREIAGLHGLLCSTYVNTIYQYTQQPEPQLLTEQMQNMRNTHQKALAHLQL